MFLIFRAEQVLNPAERLGCEELGGFSKLKAHPFFEGVDWDNLSTETPPELHPFLPAKDEKSENLWSENHVSTLSLSECSLNVRMSFWKKTKLSITRTQKYVRNGDCR